MVLNITLSVSRVSDSEEEVVSRKPKTTKLFNSDDDESDNDKKSEKSSGFVDHSDDSQGSSKSLSSRNESDHERRKATVKNSEPDDSPAKSEKPDGSDDERRSQSKKSRSSSSSSDDEKTPRSRKSSSSSNSSNKSKPFQSRKSRSNSSSSERSRSRKSSSSSSSGDEKKSQSRKSRSSSSSSGDEKKSQSRKSRSSSSSSGDEKKSQSRKSRSSSSSSSDGKRSQSRKSRSSSSSSGDEKKSQSRKSKSSSNSSDDEIRPRPKKSVKKSSSSGDKKRSKSKSDSSDNETVSQSKKSNSSDSDSRSACSQNLNKNNASDNEKSAPSPKHNSQQKSGGKYCLITASDLESEDDTRPVLNESTSDDEIRMKSNIKSKKLHKKSSSTKKSAHSKSNGLSQAFDSSGSDDEERSSPKRVQKSAAKRKSEAKPPKGSKASKKEKDPLLSIRSETQRMIREGRISLPYHQPKQRSLHEFLQRRKTAPSIPLKATPEILRNVCEQLINKEKEVEDFYKSESDNSETEAQPSNLPETETEEANDTPKDVESTSADQPVEKETPMELELDKDTNSTLTDNNESENPSSVVSEQNKDTNSTLNDDSPERVDLESNKNDDPELKKSDENPPTEKPAESISTEENPTEPIIGEGSNPQPTPKDDQITLMDVDKHIENPPKDSQDPVNVAKLNQSATELVNEHDMPDSEDFVLQIEDSCNDYTDNITKPSDLPASKDLPSGETTKPTDPLASEMLPDSSDYELRIEDSCNDTETPTETVPSSEAEKSSVNSAEPTTKPAISKDRIKNRIEALLSTRNIKLSSINLNSPLEPIQFEIPSFQPEPKGIHQLKEKFVKHSMAKKKPKSAPSQVNVVTTQTDTEGGVIGVSKETLTLGLNDEENEFSNPKLQAPGAKHAYLKKKMLDMLISKKEATWNEYQNEKRKYYGSDDEEKDIDGDNDDDDVATCKKLNFEPYHPEDEPDDDELVEDDVVYEEKTRDKNCFLDEEAEVSDVEDEEDDNPAEHDDADNAEDDDKDSVDSDGLDFNLKDDSPSIPDKSKDDTESNKLFKYNTTGSDLEKKLLGLESISQTNLDDDVSASQIFGLCSGTFATQNLPKSNNTGAVFAANQDDDFFIDSQYADDSQNICLSLPDTDNTAEKSTEESNNDTFFKQNDTPGDEDEEEEEIFTRKKPTMRIVEDSDDETNEPTNEANADASDEDNGIDDQDEDEADGENIDEDEEEEEQGAEGVDDIEAEEFGYNSEEELVSYDKAAAREFFENEAELSESEWGSEDENEKDLDKLEKEAGDDDEIDADKLKEELGKIHMRQLLDDDQHDVRLLKEMLLEDGELHSDAKRQRKFQWKSLTDGDDFFKNYSYDSDDEINLNDDDNDNDESEEHWRKIRHERETFLSQQEQKKSILNDTITETVESTFASTKIIDESIVTKIVQRTSFSSTANTSKDKLDQDLSKMNPKIKCGSFLSRGKLLLSKMTLSVSETKENLRGAKNSRNFVFGARSPKKEEVPVTVEKTEKRKSTSTSASVPKKVRLSTDNGTNPARRKGLLARLALTE